MTTEEITALFAGHAEAFARRDSAALVAHFADNCVLESPSYGTITGRAGIERVYRQFFASMPDISIDVGTILVAGDQVVMTSTISGTDTGGFLGQAPTGKQFRFLFVTFFTLDDDGKIVRERRVYDAGGLMLQLATGIAPNMGPGVPPDAADVYRATLAAARQEHELKIAAEIQRSLMPNAQHKGDGFEVVAASLPCRAIGGDFLDHFRLPTGALAFALGDVAGKGPPAALLAAQLQGILAAQSHAGGTPAETVTRVNQVLARRAVEGRFATLLYGVLSREGCLTYCNAGHNPPLLHGRRGVQRLEKGGTILGVFNEATFEDETVQLDRGDTLVVFSDGVTEALDAGGSEFGEERLLSCVTTSHELEPPSLLKCVLDAVRDFCAGTVQSDDLTVLVLRYTGA